MLEMHFCLSDGFGVILQAEAFLSRASVYRTSQVTLAGVAWAQHRGIGRVEVRVDDGPWQPATLGAVPSTDTWRQWSYSWTATPGKHQLTVRAADNSGAVQVPDEAPPDPDGATGWHSISVNVS